VSEALTPAGGGSALALPRRLLGSRTNVCSRPWTAFLLASVSTWFVNPMDPIRFRARATRSSCEYSHREGATGTASLGRSRTPDEERA